MGACLYLPSLWLLVIYDYKLNDGGCKNHRR